MVDKKGKKPKPANNSNKNARTGQPRRRRSAPGRTGPKLDAPALAHARLIQDPCKAQLVNPVYSGGEGGYLVRTDSWSTFGLGVGVTAGTFHWTPGYQCSTGQELLYTNSVTSSTADPATILTNAPGKLFLPSNAGQARCVAACVKVQFTGAESVRAGRIHYGHTSGGLITPAATYTVDSIANSLSNFQRTPPTEIEILWKPNDRDQLFFQPSVAYDAKDRDGRSAITVAFADLPANTGLTMQMVAVYEWQPRTNQGVGTPEGSRARSSNTLDEVLNFLEDRGEKFVHTAASVGGNLLNTYMSNTFGMIPAIAGSFMGAMR